MSAEEKKTPAPTSAARYGLLIDLVALAGVLTLIGADKLTPAEGLPWLAALMAGRLYPRKNSGTLTMLGFGI